MLGSITAQFNIMDINYRILWFEDTEESYATLSRRTTRYVEEQNLKCIIDRIQGVHEFEEKNPDINSYEMLVVDLKLSEDSKGYDIIEAIRHGNFVNDILFYSSEGIRVLEEILKTHRLEGVFITDRKNKEFMEKIQQLIDKSIRRSENIITIRGIVMDETSEFDTIMCEIINATCRNMDGAELISLKKYMRKALQDYSKDVNGLQTKYNEAGNWDINALLLENNFNSMMKAKTLNYVLKHNQKLIEVRNDARDLLPNIYNEEKIQFVEAYKRDILDFRNKLAHVKNIGAKLPVLIGEIGGEIYYCDKEFCSKMRKSLINYGNWLSRIAEDMSRQE